APAPSPEPNPPAEEARSTGLPNGLDWTFNVDASVGAFGFQNSLFTNPKPDQPSGNLSDNWLERGAKPPITGTTTTAKSGVLYGKLSAVGERTFSAPPGLVGEAASSFKVEDLALGFRSGKAVGGSE